MCRLLLWERRGPGSITCWEHNSKDQEQLVEKTGMTIFMVRLDDACRRGHGPLPAEAWRGGNDHPGGRFHHGPGGGRGRTPRTPKTATVTPVPWLQRDDREVRERRAARLSSLKDASRNSGMQFTISANEQEATQNKTSKAKISPSTVGRRREDDEHPHGAR